MINCLIYISNKGTDYNQQMKAINLNGKIIFYSFDLNIEEE